MELVHKAKQNLTPQLLEAFLSALLALSPGACSPWLPERLRSALFALTASVRWSGVQLGGWVHACSEESVELRGWVTLPGLNVHGFNRAGTPQSAKVNLSSSSREGGSREAGVLVNAEQAAHRDQPREPGCVTCAHSPGINTPTSGFQGDKDQLTETVTVVSSKLAGTGSMTPLPQGHAEITSIKRG